MFPLPELLDQIDPDIASLTKMAHMTASLRKVPLPSSIQRTVSFHPATAVQARPLQRNVIDILRQSRSTDASLGNSSITAAAAAETAMYRYETIIGRRLHARVCPTATEAKIACNVLVRWHPW